jgi:hypothetical protein
MHIFDVLEAWLFSMGKSFGSSGITAQFDRSSTDRPNPSCSLNLRRGNEEVDLLIWQSGEAELIVGSVNGVVSQIHFDDVRSRSELGKLLAKLVEFSAVSRYE